MCVRYQLLISSCLHLWIASVLYVRLMMWDGISYVSYTQNIAPGMINSAKARGMVCVQCFACCPQQIYLGALETGRGSLGLKRLMLIFCLFDMHELLDSSETARRGSRRDAKRA